MIQEFCEFDCFLVKPESTYIDLFQNIIESHFARHVVNILEC